MSQSERYQLDGSYRSPSPEDDLKFVTEHRTIPPQLESDHLYLNNRAKLNPLRHWSVTVKTPFVSYEDTPLFASFIIPSLYLSDVYTATSPTVLSTLGITHIVSIYDFPRDDYLTTRTLEILHIELDDFPDEKIEEYFDNTSAWIHDALANGESKVLVHCRVGASRSPTFVIAYLMAMKGMSYETALEHVQERRHMIRPNEGFVQQLKGLERRLNSADTVAKVVERHGVHSTISFP